jgi:hypothetical protein
MATISSVLLVQCEFLFISSFSVSTGNGVSIGVPSRYGKRWSRTMLVSTLGDSTLGDEAGSDMLIFSLDLLTQAG